MFLVMILLISSVLVYHIEVSVEGSNDESFVELANQLEMLEMMFFDTFWRQITKPITHILIYLLLIIFYISYTCCLLDLLFYLITILGDCLTRRLWNYVFIVDLF